MTRIKYDILNVTFKLIAFILEISLENLELGSVSNSSEQSELIQGNFSNLKDSTFCLDTERK